MRIVLDAMGGDLAPSVNLEGAVEAARAFPDLEILLAGQQEAILQAASAVPGAKELLAEGGRLSILPAASVITTEEHPVMALRKKPDSSIAVGMDCVRKGEAEAFVSAGSTGAVMAGAMFKIGRIRGIDRPALAAMLPVPGRPLLLLDAGANVDCKPEWLVQFAMMGDVYMRQVMEVAAPDVALLNIGAEAAKGNELVKSTYALLTQEQPFHFTGNLEARDALHGDADVLIADGFAGNVLLKNIEGTSMTLFKMIKAELMSSTKGKLAGLLAKDSFSALRKRFDATEVGGAPLLGVKGAVVKAHGNSNGHAIFCALRQARKMTEGDVVRQITENVERLTVRVEEPQG